MGWGEFLSLGVAVEFGLVDFFFLFFVFPGMIYVTVRSWGLLRGFLYTLDYRNAKAIEIYGFHQCCSLNEL